MEGGHTGRAHVVGLLAGCGACAAAARLWVDGRLGVGASQRDLRDVVTPAIGSYAAPLRPRWSLMAKPALGGGRRWRRRRVVGGACGAAGRGCVAEVGLALQSYALTLIQAFPRPCASDGRGKQSDGGRGRNGGALPARPVAWAGSAALEV